MTLRPWNAFPHTSISVTTPELRERGGARACAELLALAPADFPLRCELTGEAGRAATRFYRWTRSGLWARLLAELRRIANAKGRVDWEAPMVDGTSVRAHRCTAGGKRGGSAKRWAARAAASGASCMSGATAGAGPRRSC